MNFKDEEFNINTVSRLASNIDSVYPEFQKESFIEDCISGFPPLELKERITHVEKQIEKHLTDDFIINIGILSKAMDTVQCGGFIYMSVIEYLERQGCNDAHVELSLEKLGEWTRLLSSEFSIRRFLNTYEDETLKKVYEWTKSSDVHKRRLATEGTRPRLPWAQNINVDYKKAVKILDELFYDTERYVTRSCANHLNDISKFDPSLVLETLHKWKESKKQSKEEMEYIIKHSLRTLVKKGHLDTLVFLGLKLNPDILVSDINLSNQEIKIGDELFFDFTVTSNDNTNLVIDYIVTYLLKNGNTSDKVYKIRTIEVKKGETITLQRKRAFKNMTTRKMNPGTHSISIQINGTVYQTKEFELVQ